jgi:hypothetical protein
MKLQRAAAFLSVASPKNSLHRCDHRWLADLMQTAPADVKSAIARIRKWRVRLAFI